MSSASPQFNTTLSLAEMEAFIRRVVKEAVHDEFARVLRQIPASVAEDWTHEGPNDPAGDQVLLAEALEERERYRAHPEEFMDWEAFKAELKSAEAAGAEPREMVSSKIRLYAAAGMYRAGELSIGAACELAGVDRYTFLEFCRRQGVSVQTQTPDELEAEFDRLTGI